MLYGEREALVLSFPPSSDWLFSVGLPAFTVALIYVEMNIKAGHGLNKTRGTSRVQHQAQQPSRVRQLSRADQKHSVCTTLVCTHRGSHALRLQTFPHIPC